jgi:acyl-CoA thioester hydrolase
MQHEAKGYVAASNEILAMHVDVATRKSAPFPTDVQARLAEMKASHTALPLAAQVGRTLGIRRG